MNINSKNKLFVLLASILVIPLGTYLLLDNSFTANNFVFSNYINSNDPLKATVNSSLMQKPTNANEWKDPRGLFPIMAFNMPDKSNDMTASLKVIEKGGINIIINGNWGVMPWPEKIKSAFDGLGKSNLMWLPVLAADCRDDFIYGNENDETNINIHKYLNKFNAKYIYGWYIWDEPGSNRKACSPLDLIPNDDNADINTMVKQIRADSIFSEKLDFVNLYPSYWYGTPNAEAYEKYVDAFISSQEYKPRVLCFDHYPNLKDDQGGFRQNFFSNLAIIRKKSLEYEIPFWMIVLSSEHLNYRKVGFEDISLQVYSALAYSAKGIGYYLYSKCWEHVSYKSWILEDYVDDPNVPDSLHGPLFVPVQELNEQVQVLGKILNELESVEVIHTSDYPNKQKDIAPSIFKKEVSGKLVQEIQPIENTDSDSKILIGIFKEKNDTSLTRKYLLVVNKDILTSSEFQIKLDKDYKIYKFNKETGERNFFGTDQNILTTISPGSGELFYIE